MLLKLNIMTNVITETFQDILSTSQQNLITAVGDNKFPSIFFRLIQYVKFAILRCYTSFSCSQLLNLFWWSKIFALSVLDDICLPICRSLRHRNYILGKKKKKKKL